MIKLFKGLHWPKPPQAMSTVANHDERVKLSMADLVDASTRTNPPIFKEPALAKPTIPRALRRLGVPETRVFPVPDAPFYEIGFVNATVKFGGAGGSAHNAESRQFAGRGGYFRVLG